jgi:hypothetical protein
MARWLVALVVAQGCAVDPSGIPGRPDAAPMDLATEADLGGRDGGRDLGPPPDMPGCVPSPEICNGTNDDCDLAIDEDVTVGVACDGDGDGCMDGRTACLGGMERCQDGPERVGIACDGTDADEVAEGRWDCLGDTLFCADDCVAGPETCNRRDDDCNGQVDEGGVCSDAADSCRSVRRGDSIYLICTEPAGAGDGWDEAQGECGRGGYTLAQIDDEAERAFLYAEAGVGDWWVGARTPRADAAGRQDTSTWTWRPSGAAVAVDLWAGTEPSGDGSCAHLAQGLGGELNDIPCATSYDYICEGTIVP